MVSEEVINQAVDPPKKAGRRVFANFLALLGGRGVSLVLSAAASILVARHLGSQQLGQYGALYAYLSLFGWLTAFGMEPIMSREAAVRRESAGNILVSGMSVAAFFSAAAGLLSIFLAARAGYNGYPRFLLLFAVMDIIGLTPFRLPAFIFQVDLRQWQGVSINLQRQALWLLFVAIASWLHALSLLYLVIGRLACSVFETILIVLGSRRLFQPPRQFAPAMARLLVAGGLPVAANAMAIGVYHRIDQVMLHNMAGDQTLGYYVVAVNIAELFAAIPLAFMSSLFPVLSQSASRPDHFNHLTRVSFRGMMIAVLGICTLVSLSAESLVTLLYGPSFPGSAPCLRLLIWSEIPVFFGVVLSNAMLARNLERYLPFSTVAGAILNVLLNLFFIPRWNIEGAVWATIISYSAAGIFLPLLFRELRSMTWDGLRATLPAVAPALLALGLVWFSHFPLPMKIGLAFGMYGVGICIVYPTSKSELIRLGSSLLPGLASSSRASAGSSVLEQ